MVGVYEVPDTLTDNSWAVTIDFQNGICLFFIMGLYRYNLKAYYHSPATLSICASFGMARSTNLLCCSLASVKMMCQLPKEKLETINKLFRDILAESWVMVRNIQRLIGCIIPSRPAVSLTRARSRSIQEMVLRQYKGTVASVKKLVRLTSWARALQTLQLNFIWVGLGKLQGKGVTQFSVSDGGGFSFRIE